MCLKDRCQFSNITRIYIGFRVDNIEEICDVSAYVYEYN